MDFASGGIEVASPEVAATLAHELRTPLTIIRAGLYLLDERRRGLTKAQRRELMSAIRSETERLIRLVDDLVAVTRPPTSHSIQDPVMVQRLLPAIAARETAEYAPARVGIYADPATPPVRGDPDDLGRIIDNLVVAALAAGPRSRLVEIVVEPAGDDVRVRIIRDAETAPSTGPPVGSLALAAARSLAEGMGGNVSVEPQAEGRIGFVLDVPAVREG